MTVHLRFMCCTRCKLYLRRKKGYGREGRNLNIVFLYPEGKERGERLRVMDEWMGESKQGKVLEEIRWEESGTPSGVNRGREEGHLFL